jgi:hypothetical protein
VISNGDTGSVRDLLKVIVPTYNYKKELNRLGMLKGMEKETMMG